MRKTWCPCELLTYYCVNIVLSNILAKQKIKDTRISPLFVSLHSILVFDFLRTKWIICSSGIIPGLTKFSSDMVSTTRDGNSQCTFCGSVYSNQGSARMHVVRLHLVPEKFMCKICNVVIKHRLDFSNHIIRKHKMKGAKNVLNVYAVKLK